jgi:hypothetical protein
LIYLGIEAGILAHVRYQERLAALRHPAGDSLAQLEAKRGESRHVLFGCEPDAGQPVGPAYGEGRREEWPRQQYQAGRVQRGGQPIGGCGLLGPDCLIVGLSLLLMAHRDKNLEGQWFVDLVQAQVVAAPASDGVDGGSERN